MWIQKGDNSKPTFVLLHALYGTPAGLPLQKHMPHDVPIIAIQAPELLGIRSIANISERISFYRDLLLSELTDYNPCVHVMGYSLGAILAYGLAQSMENTRLCCASLCLVDPTPLSGTIKTTPKSFLSARAGTFDITCRAFLNKETSFEQGVELNDITSVGDLERHLSECTTSARELSCIADTTIKLAMELKASVRSLFPYSLIFGAGKFSGPCYLFTAADSDEFFRSQGLEDGHCHPDGVYGWSMLLDNPLL